MKHILIIDDDVDICRLLQRLFEKNGYSTAAAHSGKKGIDALSEKKPDAVLCDFRLEDTNGKDLLEKIKEQEPQLPVIIITGYSDVKMAVEIMKHGAFDYITKPLFPDEILHTVKKAVETKPLQATGSETPKPVVNGVPPSTSGNNKYIFTQQGVFGEVMKHINLVSPTNYSIIIYGESGSGKESVAQQIHHCSRRSAAPFVAIDCGALNKELAGSELFGHEKGAFTGALLQKTGSLELANGGTVFLDEVANLSYDIQVSLLRVVQERKMRRVGGTKDIELDIRIITASNEHLPTAVQKGKFREDLYHRFNEFSITVPPLRERKEDIMIFAAFFLQQTNEELNKSIKGFDTQVQSLFETYNWPGNLRELKNVIKRAALLAQERYITLLSLPFEMVHHQRLMQETTETISAPAVKTAGVLNQTSLKAASTDAEYETILLALKQANFNKSKAAIILNVDRKTLYNKMKQYKEFNNEIL